METKVCNKCDKELPATNEYFHKYKQTKDGLHYTCKKCLNALTRERWRIRQLSKPKFTFNYEREYKECSTCNITYPNTTKFFNTFSHKKKLKSGKVKKYTYLSSRCRGCNALEAKNWRIDNPERVEELNKKKDKSKYPIYAHRSYLKRKKNGLTKKWRENNREKIRLYSRNQTEELTDCYVARCIKDSAKLSTQSNIPQHIIDVKRNQLKLHREIKNL